MLFDKLKQDISFLEKRITIQERSVSNWKYATDEFYTLIPFEKELNKMKKGRWKIQCKLPPKTKRFCPLVLK